MEDLSILEQIGQKIDIQDPIKFFEYVKILDATTNQIIKYEMWPHLVEFIKAIFKYPQVIVLKSKQIGVSWTLACLLYTSPSPRDRQRSRMPSSA